MLIDSELGEAKGDNIILTPNCCFSHVCNRPCVSVRLDTRWPPSETNLTPPDDSYAGVVRWVARSLPTVTDFPKSPTSFHVTILACSQGERAVEDKRRRALYQWRFL